MEKTEWFNAWLDSKRCCWDGLKDYYRLKIRKWWKMACDCIGFKENCEKLDEATALKYTGKPFIYCPWCGKIL